MYYNPPKPAKYNFDPESKTPYKLSRTGIDSFVKCPRCFYLDKRLGISQPPGYPFTLNTAVDHLLKKEFDVHRKAKSTHPLMEKYGIDAIPFDHEKLPDWRENFVGVQFLHKPTNLLIAGAIDDVWADKEGNLMVVDYKATATERKTDLTDEKWPAYFRQMEIYQWLLRQNGHKVNDTGYFVYCNGLKDREAFDGKLEFDIEIISHEGNDSWVEETIIKAHECLLQNNIPESNRDCDYCKYRRVAEKVECKCNENKPESKPQILKTNLVSDNSQPETPDPKTFDGKLF